MSDRIEGGAVVSVALMVIGSVAGVLWADYRLWVMKRELARLREERTAERARAFDAGFLEGLSIAGRLSGGHGAARPGDSAAGREGARAEERAR